MTLRPTSVRQLPSALTNLILIMAAAGCALTVTNAANSAPTLSPSYPLDPSCLDYSEFMHWASNLDYTSFIEGGLSVRENYLYMAAGSIIVMDVSDPMQPIVVGSGGSSYAGLAVSGNYAYGIVWAGSLATILIATDISEPTSPSYAGELTVNRWSHLLAAAGDYVYLIGDEKLFVVDASAPTAMAQIASINLYPEAEDICVVNGYAYIAKGSVGLWIIDVSDPLAPLFPPAVDTPGYASGVVVIGDYAYVADGNMGLQVIDVSDPTAAYLAGSLDTPETAIKVAVGGDFAYLTDPELGVQVIDFVDPTTPVLGTFLHTMGDYPVVAAAEGAIYVQSLLPYELFGEYPSTSGGLHIIDVTNPAPVPILANVDTPGHAMSVAASGNHAFVADSETGLQIVDLVDPTTPAIVGQVDTPGDALHAASSGDHVIVADGAAGLQMISVLDPLSPAIVGSVDTPGMATMVTLAGDLACVADGESGLQMIDVGNPVTPILLGSLDTPGTAYSVAVAGSLAYVADGWIGIQIVDISSPESPSIVGALNLPDGSGEAKGIAVAGNRAFVAAYGSGFHVVDISDPETPSIITSLPLLGLNRSVTIAGDYVYLVTDIPGVLVLDISDPTQPVVVGTIDASDSVESVTIFDQYAFVANGLAGVRIFPRHCDASVPVFLADFRAQTETDGISIQWTVPAPSGPLVFRLVGRAGINEWEVPYEPEGTGRYIARDESEHVAGDQEVVYSLFYYTSGRDWVLLGSITIEPLIPASGIHLTGVHPNPFNPLTTISFTVNRPQRISISIFDMTGKLISQLLDQYHETGSYSVQWYGQDASGRAVSSGPYLVQLNAADNVESRKIMLVR